MEGQLCDLPWFPVDIDGSDLLAKAWFGDTQYHILLTDLRTVWEEQMNTEEIHSRAQDLNKRIRASVQAFFSHLCSVARPCFSSQDEEQTSKAQVSLEQHEDSLTVKLKSELAGLPFFWEFRCSTTPVTMVVRQLVCPLLAMSRVLQRQVDDLAALLARKDAEIQDYQENGAVLSRARLQTEPFELYQYRENFLTQIVPQMIVSMDSLSFDPELQALYTAVNSRSRKRKLISESSSGEERNHTHAADTKHASDISTDNGYSLASQEHLHVKESPGKPQLSETQQTSLLPSASVAGSEERSTSRTKKKKASGLFR